MGTVINACFTKAIRFPDVVGAGGKSGRNDPIPTSRRHPIHILAEWRAMRTTRTFESVATLVRGSRTIMCDSLVGTGKVLFYYNSQLRCTRSALDWPAVSTAVSNMPLILLRIYQGVQNFNPAAQFNVGVAG